MKQLFSLSAAVVRFILSSSLWHLNFNLSCLKYCFLCALMAVVMGGNILRMTCECREHMKRRNKGKEWMLKKHGRCAYVIVKNFIRAVMSMCASLLTFTTWLNFKLGYYVSGWEYLHDRGVWCDLLLEKRGAVKNHVTCQSLLPWWLPRCLRIHEMTADAQEAAPGLRPISCHDRKRIRLDV